MLGRRNIRDSIGYVTLGLFSHALLDELSEARRRPDARPVRREMIDLAIRSLAEYRLSATSSGVDTSDLVFQDLQEVATLRKTLEEQANVATVERLIEVLDGVIRSGVSKKQRVRYLDNTITFFKSLARTAVMDAESSEERVPPGVRQLAL
jgi:hypothetical protein